MQNLKVQHQTLRSKNVIPFLKTCFPNIENKSLMQTVENKFKSIRNEHLKSIYKDTNFILSLKQTKNLHRELGFSRFILNFKNRKLETYKCSGKRCKICLNYLNEANKLTMPNVQAWEILRESDRHSINFIYYLTCKMCNKKETYIEKRIGDNIKGFKVRTNQHISD